MDIEKKLRDIDEHFQHITEEELEENLMKAGFNEIRPSKSMGMELSDKVNFWKLKQGSTYSLKKTRYTFDSLPNTGSLEIEVA
ncbi:MAG TPA: hypothetical protein VK061_00965 [Bacillota bacterium]|nr:hypothetical protein [Bacillota bacterium]